jgi:hypothetical protein
MGKGQKRWEKSRNSVLYAGNQEDINETASVTVMLLLPMETRMQAPQHFFLPSLLFLSPLECVKDSESPALRTFHHPYLTQGYLHLHTSICNINRKLASKLGLQKTNI